MEIIQPPTPVKVIKKKQKKPMYSVVITSYEDDYKHRYDNGVYPSKPQLFSTRSKAEAYLCKEVGDAIMEHINDQEIAIPEDEFKEYFRKVPQKDGETEVEMKKLKYNDLSSLQDMFLKGSYVDYRLDWDLDIVTVDD